MKAGVLSGGERNRLNLALTLKEGGNLLLLDEPTRGINIGSKQEIYKLMEELAASGVAVLFVSSEMEEIIGMSDRAIVMHEGKLTGTLMRDELTEDPGLDDLDLNIAEGGENHHRLTDRDADPAGSVGIYQYKRDQMKSWI